LVSKKYEVKNSWLLWVEGRVDESVDGWCKIWLKRLLSDGQKWVLAKA
jgi:hypothetical protein